MVYTEEALEGCLTISQMAEKLSGTAELHTKRDYVYRALKRGEFPHRSIKISGSGVSDVAYVVDVTPAQQWLDQQPVVNGVSYRKLSTAKRKAEGLVTITEASSLTGLQVEALRKLVIGNKVAGAIRISRPKTPGRSRGCSWIWAAPRDSWLSFVKLIKPAKPPIEPAKRASKLTACRSASGFIITLSPELEDQIKQEVKQEIVRVLLEQQEKPSVEPDEVEPEPKAEPKTKPATRHPLPGARVNTPAVCEDCGADTEVPFNPRNNRPLYCKPCYARYLKRKKQKAEVMPHGSP